MQMRQKKKEMYVTGTPSRSHESETVKTGTSKLPYTATRVTLRWVDI